MKIVDRKGRKLEKNISVRPNGKYRVQFASKCTNKKYDRDFDEISEARAFLTEIKYSEQTSMPVFDYRTTVDAWYKTWIHSRMQEKSYNTVRNDKERYIANIQPVIGCMKVADVKVIHIKSILAMMVEDGYSTTTIEQTLSTASCLFFDAVENDLIRKSPVSKKIIIPEGKKSKEIEYFTVDEMRHFLAVAKDYANYHIFALILFTGLRISEAVGLKWKNVDLEKREIHIRETLSYRYSLMLEDTEEDLNDCEAGWRFGKTKSRSGIRTIKLNDKAYEILKSIEGRPYLMDTTPECFRDLVFLGKKTGLPIKTNTYDNALRKIIHIMTKEINDNLRAEGKEPIKPKYLSCHDLRHTYATRWLEAANNSDGSGIHYATAYKQLSRDLGHYSIKITLDLYCHLTDELEDEGTERFSNYLAKIC